MVTNGKLVSVYIRHPATYQCKVQGRESKVQGREGSRSDRVDVQSGWEIGEKRELLLMGL